MSQQTTDNFWTVMFSFVWPDPVPVSYRLYHDEQGRPLFYTMEDKSGTYVEVDAGTYALAPFNVVVKDGRLIHLPSQDKPSKLVPDLQSGVPCHVNDICIVVTECEPHIKWKMKHES